MFYFVEPGNLPAPLRHDPQVAQTPPVAKVFSPQLRPSAARGDFSEDAEPPDPLDPRADFQPRQPSSQSSEPAHRASRRSWFGFGGADGGSPRPTLPAVVVSVSRLHHQDKYGQLSAVSATVDVRLRLSQQRQLPTHMEDTGGRWLSLPHDADVDVALPWPFRTAGLDPGTWLELELQDMAGRHGTRRVKLVLASTSDAARHSTWVPVDDHTGLRWGLVQLTAYHREGTTAAAAAAAAPPPRRSTWATALRRRAVGERQWSYPPKSPAPTSQPLPPNEERKDEQAQLEHEQAIGLAPPPSPPPLVSTGAGEFEELLDRLLCLFADNDSAPDCAGTTDAAPLLATQPSTRPPTDDPHGAAVSSPLDCFLGCDQVEDAPAS